MVSNYCLNLLLYAYTDFQEDFPISNFTIKNFNSIQVIFISSSINC